MAGLYAPLPTLRSCPRGQLRTDRGRRGLLLLHRSGLSPHTPCRSPGALTRVAACTLARPPIRGPLYRRLQPFRHLHDCSGCFRLERVAGWALHPLESAAFHGAHPKRSLGSAMASGAIARIRTCPASTRAVESGRLPHRPECARATRTRAASVYFFDRNHEVAGRRAGSRPFRSATTPAKPPYSI